jgi:hypothetical protein
MCILIAGCNSFSPADHSAANDELRATITKAISLLEAEQYYQYDLLINSYRFPEMCKDEHKYNEEVVQSWNLQLTEEVLNELNMLLDQTPQFNKEGSIATFTIPKQCDSADMTVVQFCKINGKWFIKD